MDTLARKIILGLIIFLMIAVTGCLRNDALTPEADSSETEPIPVELENEVLPIEPEAPDEEPAAKEYANCYEAYLDILIENEAILTNEPFDNGAYHMGVGDGKIAIMDVFGDDTPELLLINSDSHFFEYLRIYSFSKTEGAEVVFAACIFVAAGGIDNYCVYLNHDDELMMYYAPKSSNTSSYGFWSIVPGQNIEYTYQPGSIFFNRDSAQLFYSVYSDYDEAIDEIYMQYGNEISKNQFDQAAKETTKNISRVIFQSTNPGGYGLYEYEDLWKKITPYEADCMTYKEAVSWLEERLNVQEAMVGTWHARHMMPSQHVELYHFFDDGTYAFQCSGYDKETRILDESGTWNIIDGALKLITKTK